MDTVWRLSRKGRIHPDGEREADVHLVASQDRYDPGSPLEAQFLTGQHGYWAPFWQRHPLPPIELMCDGPAGERILFSEHTSCRFQLSGEAQIAFRCWVHEPTSAPVPQGARVRIRVSLSSPGFLRDGRNVRHSEDGTVERLGSALPKLHWLCGSREWIAGVRYASESFQDGNSGRSLLIPVGMLRSEWVLVERVSWHDMFSLVEADIERPLLVLSLLSRQPISWYRIDVDGIYPPDSNGRTSDSATKRRVVEPVRSYPQGFISQERAADGVFRMLVDTLGEHPERPRLERAIQFLAGSRSAASIPEALVLAHAALETVVGAMESVPQSSTAKPRSWTRLESSVRDVVRKHASENGWEQQAIDDVIAKIGELKRPPIVSVIARRVVATGVDTSDIWPSNELFLSDLKAANATRNALFHDSHVDSSSVAGDRWERVCLLGERLILAALGVRVGSRRE